MKIHLSSLSVLFCIVSAVPAHAQPVASPANPLVDKLLERRFFTTAEITALNKDSDPVTDVRDDLDGLPLSATFDTVQTLAFPSDKSVQVLIKFNKPITGNLLLEFSGSAFNGADYNVEAVGKATLSTSLSATVRELTVPAGSRSYMLTVPLTATIGPFRGRRSLVLTLRSPAVLAGNGTSVTRTGPAPGIIASHTIVISEAERLWRGYLDFPTESGFGKLPVDFALRANGSLKASVNESKFFATSSASQGTVAADGSLAFTTPLTGTFQPTFQETGGTAVPCTWTLTFVPAVSLFPDLFKYTTTLQLSNFPCAGIQRSYSASLFLSPSR